MTKSNLKGFTLIELLIVIVIIGILAVALIPRLTGAQAAARDAARQASVQQIASAVAMYVSERPGTTTIATGDLVTNNYLSSYPTDPKSGSYTITPVSSGFTVCAGVERPVKGNSADTSGTGTASSGNYYCAFVK